MSTTQKEQALVRERLYNLGIHFHEARQLRRISMTLQRWFELECGTENKAGSSISVEREGDEGGGKPFMRIAYMTNDGYRVDKQPCADREKGARKRLAKLMAQYPALTYYIQTYPRGVALYILKKSDVNGTPIDQVYNLGIAVS